MTRRHHSLLYALLLWVPAALVQAQAAAPAPAAPPPPPSVAAAPKGTFVNSDKVTRIGQKPQGWSYNLKLGANLSVVSNKDVVGQLDGSSVLVGINILSGIALLRDKHEWLNTFALSEAMSNTPDLPFVKSGDLLDVQTLYNYFLDEYTGPFVRAQLQTSILPTSRVTGDAVRYVDDTTGAVLETGRQFHLGDAFQPITLTESAGWFVQPIHSERINVFGRAGSGGRHSFADGARTLNDDKNTTTVTEVKQLTDVHQGGVELFAGLDGKELDGKILYALGATTLFPLINNDAGDQSIAKLTRVQFQAALGFGIFSWMSLNYQLRVLRDVQMVDHIQVTNSLLLSFQYALQKPLPPAPPAPFPPEAEAKIAELEERVQKAEARAAEAGASTPVAPTPAPAPGDSAPPQVPDTTPAPTTP